VEKFKKVRDNLWNFRCPICGDSRKHKNKARGFVYRKKASFFYKCHNCGVGLTFNNFLKHIDHGLYTEYRVEKYKEGETQGNTPIPDKSPFKFEAPKFDKSMNKHLDNLSKFSDLKEDHPALSYVKNRKIPKEHWDKLYLADKFYEWSNSIFPEKFKSINIDYPRLVIPFFDKSGEIFAYQGRAFGKEEPRYITLKIVSEKEKIYGLERINYDSHVYVVEGPLDSLFIDNCIAVAGADLNLLELSPNSTTVIYDNEPRNKHTVERMFKSVDRNYHVVVWPQDLKQKDINDMYLSGIEDVKSFIDVHTYQGLEAYLKINQWKKI
jgi:transcription elongation factor Elf1